MSAENINNGIDELGGSWTTPHRAKALQYIRITGERNGHLNTRLRHHQPKQQAQKALYKAN